jgi:hypothetical protein
LSSRFGNPARILEREPPTVTLLGVLLKVVATGLPPALLGVDLLVLGQRLARCRMQMREL